MIIYDTLLICLSCIDYIASFKVFISVYITLFVNPSLHIPIIFTNFQDVIDFEWFYL